MSESEPDTDILVVYSGRPHVHTTVSGLASTYADAMARGALSAIPRSVYVPAPHGDVINAFDYVAMIAPAQPGADPRWYIEATVGVHRAWDEHGPIATVTVVAAASTWRASARPRTLPGSYGTVSP